MQGNLYLHLSCIRIRSEHILGQSLCAQGSCERRAATFYELAGIPFPTPVYADPGSVVWVGAFNYGETPTAINTAGCEYNIIGHLVTH